MLIFISGITGCAGQQGASKRRGGSQGRPPTKEQLFSQFDTDKDGRLSQEEFPGPDAHFTKLDKNSDGYLDEDEVPEAPPSGQKRR